MKPKYKVADIFRRYGDEFRKKYSTTENQRKVMAAIMACRTSLLGGHSEVCNHCAAIRNSYNSCRNRHCPKCQTMTKEEWLDKRRQELLPCGYFHLVFTLPHEFNSLIRGNRRELLAALFTAVKETLMTFAADPHNGSLEVSLEYSRFFTPGAKLWSIITTFIVSFQPELCLLMAGNGLPAMINFCFGLNH